MKYPAVAVILLAFTSQHALARSMDCVKTSAEIEYLICADSRLLTADSVTVLMHEQVSHTYGRRRAILC